VTGKQQKRKQMIKNCRWCKKLEECGMFPYCETTLAVPCIDYEPYYPTPEQWKKDTGIEWPEDGYCYWLCVTFKKNSIRNERRERWMIEKYKVLKETEPNGIIRCAICPESPADNWRPEK
jgi:hypothetical protein